MSTESRTADCIARRLARITAGELPRLHQHGADYILSDKSVKGEESTIAVLKEGKAKANEQKSGHSGAIDNDNLQQMFLKKSHRKG